MVDDVGSCSSDYCDFLYDSATNELVVNENYVASEEMKTFAFGLRSIANEYSAPNNILYLDVDNCLTIDMVSPDAGEESIYIDKSVERYSIDVSDGIVTELSF